MNLTIIIPTLNRNVSLDQVLNHYSKNDCRAKLLILDSSQKEIKKRNISICAQYKNLKIIYKNRKGKPLEVIKKNKNLVKTKYCVFTGDDDFLIVKNLKKILFFLENNHDFVGAHGLSLLFNKFHNKVSTKEYTSVFKCYLETAFERISSILRNYSVTHFNVCRSQVFFEAISVVDKKKIPHWAFYDEIAFSISLACYGKFHKINKLFLVRKISHQRNDLLKGHNIKNYNISKKFLINHWLRLTMKNDFNFSINKKILLGKVISNFFSKYLTQINDKIFNIKNLVHFYESKHYVYLKKNLKYFLLPLTWYENALNDKSFDNNLENNIIAKDFKNFLRSIN